MKASYTVEASWIMAIIMSILCSAILLSFHIYYETLRSIMDAGKEVDAVKLFQSGEIMSNLIDAIK